jgi:hypothetical protein
MIMSEKTSHRPKNNIIYTQIFQIAQDFVASRKLLILRKVEVFM